MGTTSQDTALRTAWRSQFTAEEVAAFPMGDEAQILMVNRPRAITWHNLKMNEVPFKTAALVRANADSISLSASKGVVLSSGQTAFDEVLAQIGAKRLESGMGPEAEAWLDRAACTTTSAVVDEGADATIDLYLDAQAQATTVAVLNVAALPEARVRVLVHVDSPAGSSTGVGVHAGGSDAGIGSDSPSAGPSVTGTGICGTAGVQVRVAAAAQARVRVEFLQTLDEGFAYLENTAAFAAREARIEMDETILGSDASWIGMAIDLAGAKATTGVDTHYLGHGMGKLDFNYLIVQRGTETEGLLSANGVLADESRKTLRGTIDLVRGCSGSVGREQETVLIASEGARNKTMPVILCHEDDVQGDHGATIGHVNPEQLEYLQARGLSVQQAEALFIGAQFDYAATHARTKAARVGIDRLALRVIDRRAGSENDKGEEN